MVPYWMPKANKTAQELFRLFRDWASEQARVRGSFDGLKLRQSLQRENPSLVFENPEGIGNIRSSVKNASSLLYQHKHTIAHTNYYIKRSVTTKILNWIRDEANNEKNVAMLIAQAGIGKTVVLREILFQLEKLGIDTLAIKTDIQFSRLNSITDIKDKLGLTEAIEQTIERLAKLGQVVILFDQVDALSLSLAHDQTTLNIVLDVISRLRRIPNVRVVISCRLFDRHSDPRLKQLPIDREFELTELSEEEVQLVISKTSIQYNTLNIPTRKLLRTPLHLDLFVWAMQNQTIATNPTSLTALYDLLWHNVVIRQDIHTPSPADRVEVIKKLTNYMDDEQTTSAPQTIFQKPEMKTLEGAVRWLASTGIIVSGNKGWSFLHQTFFDFCYARQIVEQNADILALVVSSEQGLFWRRKLVQILWYLRGSHLNHYLRTIERLLQHTDLRFHLKKLAIQWFGALPDPTDEEWLIAQRILLDPSKHSALVRGMYGNIGWFERLRNTLVPHWMTNESLVDDTLIPYLDSVMDIAQSQVIGLIRPYWSVSPVWKTRITKLLSHIRSWHTSDAVNLFEKAVYETATLENNDLTLYQIGLVSKAHPKAGCRMVRFVFDKVFDLYIQKRTQQTEEQGIGHVYNVLQSATLYNELGLLDNSLFDDTLSVVSKAEPKFFTSLMMDWLKKALLSREYPDDIQLDNFLWDELSGHWYENTFRTQHAFIYSLIDALKKLSKLEPAYFRQVTNNLAQLPYETTQQLLTHVYRGVPEDYAEDACLFLLEDQRRLNLGDHEQYDSRQLLKAIYPYLDEHLRISLESHILTYIPIHKSWGVEGLRWRGMEQLRILQSIPENLLSSKAISRLREWERKFPGYRVSEKPITTQGGVVGSPIPEEIARKMSDKSWLWAMRKYHGTVQHKYFLKGGAHQLSGVLTGLIKEQPNRFYTLLQKVPDVIDDAYVDAYINGLAESPAPVEWFFEVIRRFAPQENRNIKRIIAWAIAKRVKDIVPDDIIILLENYLYKLPGNDEWRWRENNHGDPYDNYLNSDRGSIFRTLMRIFDQQGTEEAVQRKWKLIGFVSLDSSACLRIGAIDELVYMIKHNRERATTLFEQLLVGHEILLESHYVREFLYWAFYKNFLRIRPYIEALMNHRSENVQEQGAQLACIASISNGAMESLEALQIGHDLAEQAIKGGIPWRRGAARVYADNITRGSSKICEERIIFLLEDNDEQVQNHIGHIFYSLHAEHIFVLRSFIETYAHSGRSREHKFAEYLWEHGMLDPVWSLGVVRAFLNKPDQPSHRFWLPGAEELVRLVLRIYTHPTTDKSLQEESMNVFDLLMEKYEGDAQKVLTEWDSS